MEEAVDLNILAQLFVFFFTSSAVILFTETVLLWCCDRCIVLTIKIKITLCLLPPSCAVYCVP